MKQHFLFFKQKGFSLIEMLIYVALISVMFLLIIKTILSFTGSYRQLAANRALEHTAINVLERMTRDIRSASDVSVSGGALTVTQTSNNISTTTQFYLQSGVVKIDVNGTYYGPLSISSAPVTNLTFTVISSSGPKAVKIDMTAQGISGTVTRVKTFHTTIIAKES